MICFEKTFDGNNTNLPSALFEQILEAAPNKRAVVKPFISYLSKHPQKMNKTCCRSWWSKEKLIKTFFNGLLYINTLTSPLCRHSMPSRRLAKCDGWLGGMARENQRIWAVGIPYWWYRCGLGKLKKVKNCL